MTNLEFNNKIDCIRKKIAELFELLVWDEWELFSQNMSDLIIDLQNVFQYVLDSENEKLKNIENNWILLIDAILKAAAIEDTIQLADLLQYDLFELLEKSLEAVA